MIVTSEIYKRLKSIGRKKHGYNWDGFINTGLDIIPIFGYICSKEVGLEKSDCFLAHSLGH